jgi:hypothetical protein
VISSVPVRVQYFIQFLAVEKNQTTKTTLLSQVNITACFFFVVWQGLTAWISVHLA